MLHFKSTGNIFTLVLPLPCLKVYRYPKPTPKPLAEGIVSAEGLKCEQLQTSNIPFNVIQSVTFLGWLYK